MKIRFHSPITVEGKGESPATQHAKKALESAKAAMHAAAQELDATKRNTRILYRVKQRMAEQANKVAESLREDA